MAIIEAEAIEAGTQVPDSTPELPEGFTKFVVIAGGEIQNAVSPFKHVRVLSPDKLRRIQRWYSATQEVTNSTNPELNLQYSKLGKQTRNAYRDGLRVLRIIGEGEDAFDWSRDVLVYDSGSIRLARIHYLAPNSPEDLRDLAKY